MQMKLRLPERLARLDKCLARGLTDFQRRQCPQVVFYYNQCELNLSKYRSMNCVKHLRLAEKYLDLLVEAEL